MKSFLIVDIHIFQLFELKYHLNNVKLQIGCILLIFVNYLKLIHVVVVVAVELKVIVIFVDENIIHYVQLIQYQQQENQDMDELV